jgi:hypothetical protein
MAIDARNTPETLPKDDGKWRPIFAFVATDDAPKTEPASDREPDRKAPMPPGTDN